MDVSKLEDEMTEIRKRLKRLEDMSGVTHFCDLRDEETEREFLGFLSGVSEASERSISESIQVNLADTRCYTTSLLYRDLISVTSVESEVHDGYATSVIRKLGITDKGREYLTEITK